MQDFRSGAAAGHRHGPDRQGLHRRRDPGDRRLVRRAEVKAGRRAVPEARRRGDRLRRAASPPGASRRRAAPRVVVVGGGFAGASCARALRQADPRIAVTLVEPNATFTACPFSNAVIAGLRELSAQQFTYERVAADGITVARTTATAVDAQARSVTLADGARLPTTGSCWRPASTSAGTRCPATTRRRPRRCRTPGGPASRRCCCAASSRPWRRRARRHLGAGQSVPLPARALRAREPDRALPQDEEADAPS